MTRPLMPTSGRSFAIAGPLGVRAVVGDLDAARLGGFGLVGELIGGATVARKSGTSTLSGSATPLIARSTDAVSASMSGSGPGSAFGPEAVRLSTCIRPISWFASTNERIRAS
ncbi:hypothetical protein ACVDFE_39880 [Lentzea chajnantorensis]